MTTTHPQPSLDPTETDANTLLNLSVLRRHNPLITHILSTAAYAVIYTYNPLREDWEKSGVEGTLFVVGLAAQDQGGGNGQRDNEGLYGGEVELERFAITVLNRQGLDNFLLELTRSEDVDVDEDIIQIKENPELIAERLETTGDERDGETDGLEGESQAYGLWIYSEPGTSTELARDENKRVIRDCASRAEEGRMRMRVRATSRQNRGEQMNGEYGGQDVQQYGFDGTMDNRADTRGDYGEGDHASGRGDQGSQSTINGRQLNLLELFGKPGNGAPNNRDAGRGYGQSAGNQAAIPQAQALGAQTNGLLDMLRGARTQRGEGGVT